MRFAVFSALILAAANGWAAEQPQDETSIAAEAQDAAAMALERLTEAREAFEDALESVETIEFREIFADGAMLGVVIRDDDDGVRVVGVTPDSGAEAAGVLVDDVIVAINDRDLADEAHPARRLRKAMDGVDPGDTVKIVLVRDGDAHNVDVEAMRRPHRKGPFHWNWNGRDMDWSMFPSGDKHVRMLRGRSGGHRKGDLKLVDVGEDLGKYFGVDAGVLVLNAPPGSELKPGDVLRRINDADIGSADEAYRLLADLDETGEATVRRENRGRTVAVEPLQGISMRAFKIMRDRHRGVQEEEVEIEVEADRGGASL